MMITVGITVLMAVLLVAGAWCAVRAATTDPEPRPDAGVALLGPGRHRPRLGLIASIAVS
ncbi:MAG: hypothetical protein L0H31_07555 [Nocardioidaceae bacterium]|nr:hypothetical protein [Nocardioidaceae bacterium]